MNIVHLYDKENNAIAKYVDLLPKQVDDAGMGYPDILHIHGCWHSLATIRTTALKERRIVITPHGDLQPWVLSEHKAQQLLERRQVGRAYTLIAMGPQEAEGLRQLGWNTRIETVANPLITKTTSTEQLIAQHLRIYQKVMDSDVLPLLNNDTRQTFRALLKAGITGDAHWIEGMDIPEPQWRLLLLYAHQADVSDVIERGLAVIGRKKPNIDTKSIENYQTRSYRPSTTVDTRSVVQLIKDLQTPTLRRLVELDKALRQPDVEDDQLLELIDQQELKQHTARIMQLLSEQTAFDEGYMLLAPLDDKQTESLRRKMQ